LGLVAGALSLALWAGGLLNGWENMTWDWRARLLARPSAFTDQIKLIVLDQATLDWASKEFGLSWPWPRQVYEPIISFCGRAGVKVLACDILFTEPSNLEGDDEALGQAISQGPAFVGALALGQETGSFSSWPKNLTGKIPTIAGLGACLDQIEEEAKARRALLPVAEVALNSTQLGNVGESPDQDQVVRRVSLIKLLDGQAVPTLGLAAFVAASEAKMRIEPGRLQVGPKTIPIDRNGRAILNYRGPPGTHDKYSAAAVIQSELRLREGRPPTIKDLDVFKDCYVFVGFTAPGLHDLKSSPVAAVYPGVEIHATVLDNLAAGDFLAPAPGLAVAAATLLLAVLAGLAGTAGAKVRHSLIAFGAFLPLPVLGGLAAYRFGLWWPMVGQEVAVGLVLVGAVLINYAVEGRQKRFIKRAFRHYLSPQVIEQILKDPSQLQLGGQRREATIFFSDLEGFTSLSEKLDPGQLTALLNDFLSEMTDIILDEGGTLDKYEGDAIIAFWNAPLDQPDHALRACRAALRCQQRLLERQDDFKKQVGQRLRMRIGIHTGQVVVGNMGSSRRFDYTVLGDAANLASRLEGANKVFGTFLMVSESTWDQVCGQVQGRPLGRIKVVGRQDWVRVYEPQGLAGQVDDESAVAFAQGLDLCQACDWSGALAVFEGLGREPAARVYAERCRRLLEGQEDDWDGVWNLTSK